MILLPKKLGYGLLMGLALLSAARAQALGVGRISVADEGGRRVLKVQTQGQAQPRLEALGDRVVISIPGGQRSMQTLKVEADPVRQIRFGRMGQDLRVVLDLSRTIQSPALGAVGPRGFSVDLGPARVVAGRPAAASGPAAAPAAAASDESLNPAQAGYTYSIVDIALGGGGDISELVISANGPASYRSAVREGGRLIILTFRNSSLAYAGDMGRLRDAAVESVSARQINSGGEPQVRLDVRLSAKLDYALRRDQNQVVLRLDRPAAQVRTPRQGDFNTLVSLDVQNADLVGVLKTLCEQAGFEYQFSRDILGRTPPESLVTTKVRERPLQEVVDSLLVSVNGRYLQEGNTLFFGSEAEIAQKRSRLPVVQRTYSPRYLSVRQARDVLAAHFRRESDRRLGTEIAVEDPRDRGRLLLVGTADDVSAVLGALARYDVPESGEAAASADGGSGLKTQVFRLQYLDAARHGALITAAIGQLFPEGETPPTPFIDPATRTLVVTTQLKHLRRIERLLARLDVRPEQVNIEGKIVEVNQSVARQLGIDWNTIQQQGTATTINTAFSPQVPTDFIGSINYATVNSGTQIFAQIDALVNERKADLVSAPNITVNDNERAVIVTRDNLVTLRTVRETTAAGTVTTTESSTFEVPLSLEVTPKISRADNRVLMRILFTLRTVTGASPAAGAPPPTSEQSADTNVNVNSGETAVIGGLVRQNSLAIERKIPILGDIPLLGMLFRYESTNDDKKEVIIFITPTIVED